MTLVAQNNADQHSVEVSLGDLDLTEIVPSYRFAVDGYLRADAAGAFRQHVELVDGEIWPVTVGAWHGRTIFRLSARLELPGFEVTGATLPTGDSLPDPDCWIHRSDAEPIGQVTPTLSRWDPADVLLVVEVSDETIEADLIIKARLYGSAGFATYWVVTPEVVYVHTDPHSEGYGTRREFRPGTQLPIPYADAFIDVTTLLAR